MYFVHKQAALRGKCPQNTVWWRLSRQTFGPVQHEDARDGDFAPLKGKIAESGEAADMMWCVNMTPSVKCDRPLHLMPLTPMASS